MDVEKRANTNYPVNEMIARRWSPRAFGDQPVAPEQVRSLLEAARWAASSFNEQPWRFIVARKEDGEAFDRMVGCLMEGNRSWARGAAVLILTVVRTTFTHNDRPNRTAVHDLGLAVGNLTMQAMELGLWLHQMAGIETDTIRETYGVPDGYEPVTAIAIGHPGDPDSLPDKLCEMEKAPRSRKSQDEFVFDGTWGQPATW
jgi:nitroreductase